MRKILLIIVGLLALCVICGGAMLVFPKPANPPVVTEPKWDSPQTRELAQRACYDCHSNETVWPWYSNIMPFTFLIRHDVSEGRQRMNFSNWGQARPEEAGDVSQIVLEGEMPPAQYLLMHPNARLTDAERQQLARGLSLTLGGTANAGGGDD
jgi:hypothetical protein